MATYSGKINNLITGNDLYSLMDLSMGTTNVTGDITWLKFIVGDYEFLIADRCLKVSISPNDMNPKNAMQGKDININGVTYQCRCLGCSEWTETIVTHTPDNADSNWKSVQTWTRDMKNFESYYVVGGGSVNGLDYWYVTSNRPTVGWRPVLVKLKEVEKLPSDASLSSAVANIGSIKSKISNLYDTLKTNLIAKGVEVLPNDKMSNLINKVHSIQTGKKWASGVIETDIQTSSTTTSYVSHRIACSFSFTPTRIVLNIPRLYATLNSIANYTYNITIDSKSAFSSDNAFNRPHQSSDPSRLYVYISNIDNTGFTINIKTEKYQSNTYAKLFAPIEWTAYE